MLLAPRSGGSEEVGRSANSRERTARESARWACQRCVNEHSEKRARRSSCQPGVNGHSERLKRGRVTKVKRPCFHRAFSSVARGRYYDWTTCRPCRFWLGWRREPTRESPVQGAILTAIIANAPAALVRPMRAGRTGSATKPRRSRFCGLWLPAGAQRGLCTAISLGFERKLVA